MKVSIIIPAYNMAEFLPECVESALSQTYQNHEIIVVNDGSTDNTLEVAQHYPVTVLDICNHGLSAARNAGVLNSTGELLLPLDADDYIHPEYLAKTVPLMRAGIGIVSTDMQYFGIAQHLIPAIKTNLQRQMRGNEIPVCSLIRREAFLQTGGYSSKVRTTSGVEVYEDWNMWIDILKRGWDIAVVNEPLFFYRRRPASMVSEADGQHEYLHDLIKKLHREVS